MVTSPGILKLNEFVEESRPFLRDVFVRAKERVLTPSPVEEELCDLSVTKVFNSCSGVKDYELHADKVSASNYEERALQANMVVALFMGNLTPEQVVSPFALAMAQIMSKQSGGREASQKVVADFLYLSLLENLRSFESDLERRLGKNFAEDLFAQLHEEGIVKKDEYNRIMAIQDQEERRAEIARHVQKKIDDGTLDVDELNKNNPWVKEWLELRQDVEQARDHQVQMAKVGKVGLDEISLNAADMVSKDSDFTTETKANQLARENDTHLTEVDMATSKAFLGNILNNG